MWYIDRMQNCDNLAIDSRMSRDREGRGSLNCCLWHNCVSGWFPSMMMWAWGLKAAQSCSLFEFLLSLSCPQNQTGLEQPLSWCINYMALLLPLYMKEAEAVSPSRGTVPSPSAHHRSRRCSRLGVRWYLMWRGPVSFSDILSWVRCCTAPIPHRSQSRSHQMALKSEAERVKMARTKIVRDRERDGGEEETRDGGKEFINGKGKKRKSES